MVLTQERLMELLFYNPDTGVFTRLMSRGNAKIGSVAGTPDSNGHLQIRIDGKKYLSQRLAWLYMTGEWPKDQVDHRNLDKPDNRWDNLRAATSQQNRANTPPQRNNKSGWKGIHWHKKAKKWKSQITANGTVRHLGLFDCPAAAHFAYIVAADKAFGEFARAG